MKSIIVALGLLMTPLLANAAQEPSKEQVYKLAQKPFAQVANNHCVIQGAVWAIGPRADVLVALVDDQGQQIYTSKTDKRGIYLMRIPLNQKALTLREVVLSPIGVKKEFAKDAQLGTSTITCQA